MMGTKFNKGRIAYALIFAALLGVGQTNGIYAQENAQEATVETVEVETPKAEVKEVAADPAPKAEAPAPAVETPAPAPAVETPAPVVETPAVETPVAQPEVVAPVEKQEVPEPEAAEVAAPVEKAPAATTEGTKADTTKKEEPKAQTQQKAQATTKAAKLSANTADLEATAEESTNNNEVDEEVDVTSLNEGAIDSVIGQVAGYPSMFNGDNRAQALVWKNVDQDGKLLKGSKYELTFTEKRQNGLSDIVTKLIIQDGAFVKNGNDKFKLDLNEKTGEYRLYLPLGNCSMDENYTIDLKQIETLDGYKMITISNNAQAYTNVDPYTKVDYDPIDLGSFINEKIKEDPIDPVIDPEDPKPVVNPEEEQVNKTEQKPATKPAIIEKEKTKDAKIIAKPTVTDKKVETKKQPATKDVKKVAVIKTLAAKQGLVYDGNDLPQTGSFELVMASLVSVFALISASLKKFVK